MSLVSQHRASARRSFFVGAFCGMALIALLAFASRAQAAETIYWANYGDNPDTLGFAAIDGGGGGQLNTGTEPVEAPEGLAYDTVSNRLFVTTGSGVARHILAVNLDGSGAAHFTAPGAPIAEPEGIAVDPTTQTLYWENTKTGQEAIVWAKLDGSSGGVLNTSGVTVDSPCCRIAVDPSGGRVYWVNNPASGSAIAFANLNNTGGGGTLSLAGATVTPGGEGLAVDSAGGRVYFLGGTNEIGYANTNGSGGGNVGLGSAPIKTPWGLAFDPSINRLYWGNEGNAEVRTGAFGFVTGGVGGGIDVVTAPIANPQDPVILKSPSGTGAPAIARSASVRSELTCSQGSWAADFAGGFVYQAPRTYAYQWALNGAPIAGATAATLAAGKPGSYTCAVTATNHVGNAAQTSAAINVKAAKVKLTTKKKAKVKAGGVATFKVKGVNQGDLKSKNARVCVKLPKKAKGDLKAKPKCKALGKVKGGGKDSAKLRIKVGDDAKGTYKVTFQVKGSPGKAAKAKIIAG
jgi:hypothetical protein